MDDEIAQSAASTIRLSEDSGVRRAGRVAAAVRERWSRGEEPDVAAVLAEHPELKRYRSVVLDLAHDEYCLRVRRGESLDVEQFSRRFPSFQRSLCLFIEVHRLIEENPHLEGFSTEAFWPSEGEQLLGFSIIAELGRGTFARVYLASEPALGNRLVAVKMACRGAEEAEMLGRLRHPNIVPVHSVREDPDSGLTVVCMPYLGRATLCDVLDRAFENAAVPSRSRLILDMVREQNDNTDLAGESAPDPFLIRGSYVDGVIHLAVQLADALVYTHTRGICHRDLKPSNVLLSPEGRPFLLDFNLSVDRQLNATRVGGTLPYMAPEQIRSVVLGESGPAGHLDPRADLFSLGVIVYELLTGQLPFGEIPWQRSVAEVAGALLDRHARGPEPIRRKNPRVDKPLARVIERCLAFDPDERPQTAADLLAALRRQLTPVRRARRWAGNHPKRVTAFATLLLAAVLAVAGYLALRDPYSVRQFKQAQAYAAQGDYDGAVKHLNQAIRVEPNNPEFLLARAKAYQELGEFGLALDDLRSLAEVTPDPALAAGIGYCFARLGHHKYAIQYYSTAAANDLVSPTLLNNTAFSCLRMNELDRAEGLLIRAIQLDPNLGPAYHNLVMVAANRAQGGQPVSQVSLKYAKKALENCRPSADLYRDVARLFSLASSHNPDLLVSATECLRKAVALGLDPASFSSTPEFLPLKDRPEFQALLTLKPGRAQPVPADRLIDPLDELPALP